MLGEISYGPDIRVMAARVSGCRDDMLGNQGLPA